MKFVKKNIAFLILFLSFLSLNSQTIVKVEKDAPLRKEPNVGSDFIKTIPAGSQVRIIYGPRLCYYFIDFEGAQGFINEVYFSEATISSIPAELKPGSIVSRIKIKVAIELNKWQKKGEFERISDYEARVNAESRKIKTQQFTDTALKYLKAECRNKINSSTTSLGNYDAENQSFLIKTTEYGNFPIKVPISMAPTFKLKWNTMLFKNIDFSLKNEDFEIAKADIYFPEKKQTYSYDSKNVTTYTNINIDYYFPSVDLATKNQNNTNNNSTTVQTKNLITGKSDVDIDIPINTKPNENYFAVIIGNENYKNEIKVDFAINDAKSINQYFNKTIGIPVNNIHYIENATFGQMLSEIEWLNNISKAFNGNAKLYFYYAGHGVPNEQTKSAYLLPVDGNSSITQTAIKTEDLYNKLTQNKPLLATVFLDACFSGAAREGMLADGRGVTIKPKQDLLQGNIVVFSAASDNETAHPFKEKQHGLFTYFLLKKIKESKGEVNYNDLSEFIKLNVNQQSIIINQKTQTPQSNISSELNETWKAIKIK
jgi:hypothetical protein